MYWTPPRITLFNTILGKISLKTKWAIGLLEPFVTATWAASPTGLFYNLPVDCTTTQHDVQAWSTNFHKLVSLEYVCQQTLLIGAEIEAWLTMNASALSQKKRTCFANHTVLLRITVTEDTYSSDRKNNEYTSSTENYLI